MNDTLPPLPPGFTIDTPGDHPPLPPGFTLDGGGATSPQEPSAWDYLRTNPVLGAPIQGALQGGQGLEQLGARGIDAIAGTNLAPGVDKAVSGEIQGYQKAKDRVSAASTNPGASQALQGTGEAFGGMLNPAGLAGKAVPVIKALGPLANTVLQGAVSGAGFGASQPVTGGDDFWTQKAQQTGFGAAAGGATNAATHLLLMPKPSVPTTAQLKSAADAEYKSVANVPVNVTSQFLDAIQGQSGKAAINRALEGADANRETGLANELRSLISQNPPATISANAADKVSQALREAARAEVRNPTGSENIARGLSSRRADVESSLAQVPQLKDARGLWSRYERSAIIDETIQDAKDNSRTPAGAGGVDQSLRREFGKLIRSKEYDGFSPDEQDAIKQVANGTLTSNTLQRLGKFSPIRNHLAAFFELAGATGGGAYQGYEGAMPALAIAAGGEAARQASEHMTMQQALAASRLVRQGSQPLAPLPQTSRLPIGNWATSLLLQPLLKPASP